MEEKEIREKVEEFHSERIEKLTNNETPIPSFESGKIVIHLIPFETFASPKHCDLSGYKGEILALNPLTFQDLDQMYDFDGMLHFELREDRKCSAYVHAYFNGIIEAVDCIYLGLEQKELFIFDIEERIIRRTKEYIAFQKKLGIEPPVVFYLGMLGAKDFLIKYGNVDETFDNIHPIDRNDLILPKVTIESSDASIEDLLKTNFDRIWSACGYSRSFHYDEKGNWKEKTAR